MKGATKNIIKHNVNATHSWKKKIELSAMSSISFDLMIDWDNPNSMRTFPISINTTTMAIVPKSLGFKNLAKTSEVKNAISWLPNCWKKVHKKPDTASFLFIFGQILWYENGAKKGNKINTPKSRKKIFKKTIDWENENKSEK